MKFVDDDDDDDDEQQRMTCHPHGTAYMNVSDDSSRVCGVKGLKSCVCVCV